MLETKLELAATELINNKYTKKFNLNLESLAELLLNIPYFKKFVGTYGDVGPLTFINLLNHLNFKIYNPKTIIWDYNDIVDGVYLIISGEVNIYKPPDKSKLIRCKNVQKRKKSNIDDKTNAPVQLNKVAFSKTNNKLSFKLPQFTINLMQKSSRLLNSNTFKSKKKVILKHKNRHKLKRSFSAKYTCILTLEYEENKNISKYEKEIRLTDKDYLYREPQESKNLDYVETFGKIIGEDAVSQELIFRKYACETSTKCILAFLSAQNYHIFFDKINNSNKGSIISFLFRVNYFNDKNDFIHKLSRIVKVRSLKKGMNVYNKNSPLTKIYIIRDGNVSIDIIRSTKYKSDLNPDLLINNNEIKNRNNSAFAKNKINNKEKFSHFTKERFFEIKGEYQEEKLYTLINYGKGEILGNIEYYLQLKKYLYTVKCMTDVELYEIDIDSFNYIIRSYNFELFEEKTKEQINFLKNRIREVKLIHERNDDDQYKSRNKFMRIIYQRHPLSSLKINKKYINDGKYYIPTNLKYTKKKMKNTQISPFCLYELASAVSLGKIQKPKNPFITNNIDYAKIFNENKAKNQNQSSLNKESHRSNKYSTIVDSNIIKLENKKEPTINKNHRTSVSVENIRTKRLIYNHFRSTSSKFGNRQILKIESKYRNIEKKNKSEIDKGNKDYNISKNMIRFSFNSLNFNFNKHERKSEKFIANFINMYQKAQKENIKKTKHQLKVNINKPAEKKETKELTNTIVFDGYRVYLQKNKRIKPVKENEQ